MKAVYPARKQPRARAALLAAACLLVLGGCNAGEDPNRVEPDVALRPRRFALGQFLASRATAANSPTAARLLAAAGLSPNPVSQPSPPQSPFVPPPGFRVAAVTSRGDRIVLLRDLDPDSTEVVLHDRGKGDTRLLLPVAREARFLPQRFSHDGDTLLLFTDEDSDTLQLELLNLDTGERLRRARPGCEALHLDPSPDGIVYSLQWSCSGAVEAALFDFASGLELGPLPLPSGTRLARALPGADSGNVLYEVASGHFPRDLVFAERLDPEARARPLTFGLAPAIAAADLVEPSAVTLPGAAAGEAEMAGSGAPDLPAELWWPRRPVGSPPALIWIEHDLQPPSWQEFHPFLQFLANRGVAVLRLRPSGAQGFGKRFRHAADGRLVDAGLENLDAAHAMLTHRGADPQRIAVLGEGPWAGALAAIALVERAGRFVAAADLGGDPDPLLMLDLVPTLREPARSWWIRRLGDPSTESAQRDRTRMRFPQSFRPRQLFLAFDAAAQAWSAEALTARQSLDQTQRVELTPGTGVGSRAGFAALSAPAVAGLWEFLSARLGIPP